MLEFALGSIAVIGVVVWFLKRPKKQGTAPDKPVAFVCPQCGDKDCHCERRT